MALYNCSECGHRISEFTNVCPNCGAADSGQRSKAASESSDLRLGIFIFIVLVIGAILFMNRPASTVTEYDQSTHRSGPTTSSESDANTNDDIVATENKAPDEREAEEEGASREDTSQLTAFYTCRYGTYSNRSDADSVVKWLKAKDYSNVQVLWIPSYSSLGNEQLYMVVIGKLSDHTECEEYRDQLRTALDNPDIVGVRVANDGNSDLID